jgi:hypothetical protein
MKLPGENIAIRWPIATPCTGLAVPVLVTLGLLIVPSSNGPWLSLLAASSALLNGGVLLVRLHIRSGPSK